MSNESFKIKNGLTLTPVDLTSLTNPQAGDLACDINDLNKIKRYDANSLGWTEVGSGGVGNVNALLTQTFDTAALAQFTQTGLALTTSNPIDGTQSARLIHQAASSQSFKQVIAVDRKYRGDLMAMSLQVRSSATSGNLTLLVTDETNSAVIMASSSISTGQYQVATAVTNTTTTISGFSNVDINSLKVGMTVTGAGIPTATVISSINTTANTIVISQAATASATITAKFSALPDRKSFSFTIPTNCASLSYTVTALQEAGLPESYIDDIVIELANVSLLETSVTVPNLTAWQGYTPTGNFSNTTYSGKWRQVGESIEIQVKGVLVGVPTGDISVGLPNGYVIDTTKLASSLPITHLGTGHAFDLSTNAHYELQIGYNTSTAFYATYNTGTSGQVSAVSPTLPFIWASGDSFDCTVRFPVIGLTASSSVSIPLTQSGLVQEADSSIVVEAAPSSGAAGFGSTNTFVMRFVTITENKGSDFTFIQSATLGDSIVVNTAGIYNVSASAATTINTNIADIVITRNNIATSTNLAYTNQVYNTASTLNKWMSCSATGYFNVGDVIRLCSTSPANFNVDGRQLKITKQGSLKQVTVNTNSKITIPTSELRFEGASTRGSTDTAIVKFDTQAKIRGDAFSVVNTAANGTVITMLKAGRLQISSTLNSALQLVISKNQTDKTTVILPASEQLAVAYIAAATSVTTASSFSDVNIGDVIRVAASSAPVAGANNQLNLAFQEQEIQVSVSNTLPQFSESDSSVRVVTGNGFGSTSTSVRRFASTTQNIGTDITYTDSPTAGASFTVNTSGIYSVTYTDGSSSSTPTIEISINGASAAQSTISTATGAATTSISIYLVTGDIVRAVTGQPASIATSSGAAYFTISKVGKPNVTGVNVTPFVNVPQPVSQSSHLSQAVTIGVADITGALASTNGSGIYSYNSSTGVYTVLKKGNFHITALITATSANICSPAISINGSNRGYNLSENGLGQPATANVSLELLTGDTIKIVNLNGQTGVQSITVLATATSDTILTAPETFSTDTASLTYAPSSTYTLATLANAPVGTFITFTYAINTNTRTQTTTAPTQTTADMNANGLLVYTRTYNAPSTAAQPAAIAIQIGKGLKGRSLGLYKSSAKVTSGTIDGFENSALGVGLRLNHYNELTGILYIDGGYRGASVTQAGFEFEDLSFQTSGYLVVNASKNPALTGMNLNRVAARGVSSSGQSIPAATVTTLILDAAKTFDTHNALNAATGIFTAPESGYYQANVVFVIEGITANTNADGFATIRKNGIDYRWGNRMTIPPIAGFSPVISSTASDIIYLNKGETCSAGVYQATGAARGLVAEGVRNNFSIVKVSI